MKISPFKWVIKRHGTLENSTLLSWTLVTEFQNPQHREYELGLGISLGLKPNPKSDPEYLKVERVIKFCRFRVCKSRTVDWLTLGHVGTGLQIVPAHYMQILLHATIWHCCGMLCINKFYVYFASLWRHWLYNFGGTPVESSYLLYSAQ